jgi:hypothetical protein
MAGADTPDVTMPNSGEKAFLVEEDTPWVEVFMAAVKRS